MAQIEEIYSHAGLTDTVRSSLFVPSDHLLLAGCADLTGRDITTKKETHKYKEHEGSIYSLCLSDNLIYSGSADKTLKAWDLRASKSVYTYKGHTNTVRCIQSCQINGSLHIITGSYDATVRIWSVLSKTCIYTLHPRISNINSLCVNYPYLWVGGEGIALKFDISEGQIIKKQVAQLKVHTEAITNIYEWDDCLITSSVDTNIKISRAKGNEFVCMQTLQTLSPTAAAIIVPEVSSLFSCGATIQVWGVDGWYNSCTADAHKLPIRSLTAMVKENGEALLASGSQDKSQKVWRIIS